MLSLLYSFIFGIIGFGLGFSGPLTPAGNLGPLMGFFITGPTGALVGAVAGIVHSALCDKERNVKAELLSLILFLILSLLYLLFISSTLSLHLRAVPIVIQIFVVFAGYFLFVIKRVSRCSHIMQEFQRMFLIAGILIIFASLFPPVTRPWWAPKQTWEKHSTTQELPLAVFIFDKRFDASQRVPEFAIDRGKLICEAFTILAIAGVVGYIIAKRQRDSALNE